MFELIAIEFFQHTPLKDWYIVSLLKYVKSKTELSVDMLETLKTEIRSVLRVFSDVNNKHIHENAKKKQ